MNQHRDGQPSTQPGVRSGSLTTRPPRRTRTTVLAGFGRLSCVLAPTAATRDPFTAFRTARRRARLIRIVGLELSLQFERGELHPQRGQITPQGHPFRIIILGQVPSP